ncbi:hypothetical protein [Paraburkholderia sp. D1E]|uniref:hypothetical protein n=1 Tax=Paraburkholderia sp. D1E TaxID=3461398 RepID=UPI004045DDEC
MKIKSASLCIAGLVALTCFSGAKAKHVVSAASATTTTTAVSVEHTVGPCRFRITNMFGGDFDVPHPDSSPPQQGSYYLPLTGPMAALNDGFSLFCIDATEKRLTVALNARYADGRCLNYGPVGGPEFVPFDEKARFRTIKLKGKNWIGRAYTADDTTGDEKSRARVFHFCLIHNAYALCGDTPVVWLARPKRNQLWKIKAILESVEFVDAPLPASAAASAATASQ